MVTGEDAASATSQPLASVLLEFGKAPGRYSLRRGEPPALHVQLDTVALWAMGRIPPVLQKQSATLQKAAITFVHRACFVPDNTHYQVLGLAPHAINPEILRARYRTLIRLAHPDMRVPGLPPDAAGMVNRAHAVLGNAALRSTYDQQLAQAAAKHRPAPESPQAPPARHGPENGKWLNGSVRKGSAERWQAWAARFPGLVRFCVVGGSTGLLVAIALVWAALDAQKSSSLVVARARQEDSAPQKNLPQQTAPLPSGRKNPVSSRPPPSGSRVSPGLPSSTASVHAAKSTSVTASRSMPVRLEDARVQTAPPAPALALASPVLANSSIQPWLTAPPPGPVPVPVSLAIPLPAQAPANPIPAARSLEAAASVIKPSEPAMAAAGFARQRSGLNPEMIEKMDIAPAPVSALQPSPASTASVPPPRAAVDPVQARIYLLELLNSLEHQADAQRTHDYLGRMNVRGNLLASPLRLAQQSPFIQVTGIALSPVRSEPISAAAGEGKLALTGVLELHAASNPSIQGRKASYRVLAQFITTEKGPALAQLELKEMVD